MWPKTPNSFSSLRAHRAASCKNATAQSSNDASFGDIREEARSSSRLSLRRRGTLPHRGMQIYEEMSETTNFCRLLPPILHSSRPDVPSFSHTRRGFPPPEGSSCRKLHKYFSKVPCFWRKLHDFSPKVHSFARPAPRCRHLLAHRRPPLAAHSAPTPDKPRLLLSSFAITRRNDSAAPEGVKWVALKSAQLHNECANTAILLLKIRKKHTKLDNDTSPGEEKAHRIARNEKRLFDFTSHTP